MSTYRRQSLPIAITSEEGFGIVESVVAAALLLISTVVIMSIFDSSILRLRRSSEIDAINAAISADIAQIERFNDYYNCSAGNCTVPDPLPASPPTKFQYIPDSNSPNAPLFKALCAGTGGTNLASALVAKLQQTSSLNAGTSTTPIPIERRARLHPNNTAEQHLYIVEWIPSQGTKRQIILEPTVSSWCP